MLTKEEVKHIATLARIGMSEKDLETFSHDLTAILDWIEQLKEVDVEGVEPTAHITGVHNATREDNDSEFDGRKGITGLFPEEKNGYNKVKSVF